MEGPAASAVAAPLNPASSSAPIAVYAGLGAILLALAVFFLRRPILSLAGGGRATVDTDERRRRSRSDHAACAAGWTSASASTNTARQRAARALADELDDLRADWDNLATKVGKASAAFAPLRATDEDEPDEDEELALALRILEGLPDAISEGLR
jgi:hypothetical protein